VPRAAGWPGFLAALAAALGGRRDPWTGQVRAPYQRTLRAGHPDSVPARVGTGNQSSACAVIRNLVIGAFRRAGYANIAHACRCHGRNGQRVLA